MLPGSDAIGVGNIMEPEDLEEIRKAMELTDDNRALSKGDLARSDDLLVLRFGVEDNDG